MIEEKDLALLDLRYKLRQECDDEMRAAQDQHSNLDKRLAVIEVQQKANNWLTAAIAAGIITLVIKIFVGG